MSFDVVSGTLSTIATLEKDEAWLQGWLKEKPSRLGLGELKVADGEPVQDGEGNPAFLATDEGRSFSVSVRLGELEAAHGFSVLDSWARNRVRHHDKTHVAVLVTETAGDRYRPTLEALAEHLPLVVVELQVWRGEKEAIVVPHVALASDDVDLAGTPASTAAKAVSTAAKAPGTASASAPLVPRAASDQEDAATSPETVTPENKDDTGVSDPWGLPKKEPEAATSASGTNGNRLLTKFNT
jgi:hypothetical protein